MNVGFIINNLGFGGAEKMATFVANSFSLRGHNVSIFVLNSKIKKYQTINNSIKVYSFPKASNNNPFIQYFDWIRLFKPIVREERIQILISFLGTPNLVCVLLGKILRIPSVISERGDPYTSFKDGRWVTKVLLWIYNHSNGAVFQTEKASKFYGAKLQEHSKIIPNPIFINGRVPKIDYNALPKTIVYLGRLDNFQKRIDILLLAFREFYKSHNGYKLVIYGKGPAQVLIENFIRQNNLDESIIMKGVSTSPMEDLAKEGIYVITSDFEGISNSLLEAMALGMPVVSTDHSPGGGRLLVKDHVNGLLVPTGSPYLIARALSEFAENPELRERCGREATKVIQRFDSQKIMDIWESYIKKIYNGYN